MRSVIYTAFNEAYSRLAEFTIPRMAAYARQHWMSFEYYTEPLDDIPDAIYWLKFSAAQRLLREYDRVIWLDVDQLITNMDAKIAIPDEAYGFHVSKDWGHYATEPHHFSVCGFAAHKDSLPLFEAAWELEPASRGKPFPEQQPMRDVVQRWLEPRQLPTDKHFEGGGFITLHGRKVFNCVPLEVSDAAPEPWEHGDFAAHLTMVDLASRVSIAKTLLTRLGI